MTQDNYRSFDHAIRKLLSPDVGISAVRYVASFLGVLLFGAVLIAAQGEDPVNAAKLIVNGAFGNMFAIGNTLRWATPCILTGAAAIVASKSGIANLGIEGQMYIGAFVAAIIGWQVPLPAHLHAIVCLLAAGVAGVLWVIIPTLMRLYLRIDEYVTTMMMNFIATLLCDYLVVWVIIPAINITTVTIKTPDILDTAKLTTLVKGTSSSSGFLIGIAVCLFVFVLYKYTIKGYELKQVGENLKFAKTGGVNVKKTFIFIFVLSGFLAGLAGGVEVNGGYYRYVSNFSASMGWEGIMIANISNRNPIALIFVSLVWGALKTGAMSMERSTSLNRLTVNLLQMLFVLLVSINYEGIFEYFRTKKLRKQDRIRLAADQEG